MRRVRRFFRTVLVVVFLAVAAIAIYSSLADVPASCETSICCTDCETVAVARVIDGDTLVVNRIFRPDQRVRLYGVDTPERGESCFAEATERLIDLAGTSIRVEAGPRSEDVYGRKLYYIYTESGESIDELLVREGLGRAWATDGQHRDTIVELEREAASAGRGCLW